MQKKETIQLTKEKIDELRSELRNLIDIERPRAIEEIRVAREQGDLSENAEYDAAREKQGIIEDKISELEQLLENAEIIKKTKSNVNKVSLLSKVTIKSSNSKKEEIIEIVNTLEADPFKNKISTTSPLGEAIFNRGIGEEVEVIAPKPYKVKILSIE